MKKHPFIRLCWFAANFVLAFSVLALACTAAWEFSTRSYLKGFSDAIIPAADDPEQKVEAILNWMAHGPARRTEGDTGALAARNPEETLNVQRLLEVCGTATNAFVNLAESSGLHSRRLLLLDSNEQSKHVVVEVLIHGRWIIVDPSYHFIPRLPDGQFTTRAQLMDPSVLQTATQSIPNYPAIYSYEKTVHVRLARIPWIGKHLRRIFNFIWPQWEEAINWTMLVERESFAALVASMFLLCFALASRIFLGWYCKNRLGIPLERLRDQILHAGHSLSGSSQ
jgi:hypothetical protein